MPRTRGPLPSLDGLPQEVLDAIAEAMPIYEQMHARRIRPAPSPLARDSRATPPSTTTVLRRTVLETGGEGSGSEKDGSSEKEGSDTSE